MGNYICYFFFFACISNVLFSWRKFSGTELKEIYYLCSISGVYIPPLYESLHWDIIFANIFIRKLIYNHIFIIPLSLNTLTDLLNISSLSTIPLSINSNLFRICLLQANRWSFIFIIWNLIHQDSWLLQWKWILSSVLFNLYLSFFILLEISEVILEWNTFIIVKVGSLEEFDHLFAIMSKSLKQYKNKR
jgi:hypothetical protein